MKTVLALVGWSLRASALICIVWTAGQVMSGSISSLTGVLSAAAWHAGFALSGVALVGASRARAGVAPDTGAATQ